MIIILVPPFFPSNGRKEDAFNPLEKKNEWMFATILHNKQSSNFLLFLFYLVTAHHSSLFSSQILACDAREKSMCVTFCFSEFWLQACSDGCLLWTKAISCQAHLRTWALKREDLHREEFCLAHLGSIPPRPVGRFGETIIGLLYIAFASGPWPKPFHAHSEFVHSFGWTVGISPPPVAPIPAGQRSLRMNSMWWTCSSRVA
jgi:hypothetical protein